MQKEQIVSLKKSLEPYVNSLMVEVADEYDSQQKKPGTIPKSSNERKVYLEEKRKELFQIILNEQGNDLIKQGFNILIEEEKKIPMENSILEEFKNAGNKLYQNITQGKIKNPVFDYASMQDWLHFSNSLMQKAYKIGLNLFQEQKLEEATAVFTWITAVNPYYFDPWLMLGICYLKRQMPDQGLVIFSAASEIDSNHPAPLLYSAEAYLEKGNISQAQIYIDSAQSFMSKEDSNTYANMIGNLINRINNKNKL